MTSAGWLQWDRGAGGCEREGVHHEQRTLTIDGASVVCEWHPKIKRHIDRIYFDPGNPKVAGGRLIVGFFTHHFD